MNIWSKTKIDGPNPMESQIPNWLLVPPVRLWDLEILFTDFYIDWMLYLHIWFISIIIIRTSAVKTIWKVEMINRARAELFPGEENVLRFACPVINYSLPLILQNVSIISPPPHVRMFTLPFGQIVQKTWLEGRHLDNANRKVFARPRPKPWKLRQTVWKVFGGTRMFPDMLENFWTVWKIYGLPG